MSHISVYAKILNKTRQVTVVSLTGTNLPFCCRILTMGEDMHVCGWGFVETLQTLFNFTVNLKLLLKNKVF